MPEERKEMWTTLIRKGDDSGFNLRRAKKITEVYDDISQYKPKYLPAGSMGYDSRTLLYTLSKPIKVRNSDGSFTVYEVPEFAVDGVYIPLEKPKVEPIANLVTLNQLSSIPVLQLPVQPTVAAKVLNAKPVLVSTTTKSKPIVKQSVPLALLPHVANVSSNGTIFFKVPDGYTNELFMSAVNTVILSSPQLLKKSIPLYELPQLLVLQEKEQQLEVLQSLTQYLNHKRLLTLQLNKNNRLLPILQLNLQLAANGNAKDVQANIVTTDNPDLVEEMFVYPSRDVHVYSIHPEAYLKILELLKKEYPKGSVNSEYLRYVISPYGLEKVPIGGEVNDSTFHYISKDGDIVYTPRLHYQNPYLLNINEPYTTVLASKNDIPDDPKIKVYSYSNSDKMVIPTNSKYFIKLRDLRSRKYLEDDRGEDHSKGIKDLTNYGLSKLQAKDYIEKQAYSLIGSEKFANLNSLFHPIKDEQPALNNTTQLPVLSNAVQKAKTVASNAVLKGKQAAKKVLSIFGFLNGGQLKYYNNGKQIRIK